MEIIDIVVADKKHFKKFKLKNDIACKLEFLIEHKYCQVKYCDENFGFYNAQNLDLMILEFLEELADYNNGDSSNVKTKLENSVEEKVNTPYNRYPTTYKNSMLKYLIGLEDNIIKTTCIEQKLTYQQLADEIGLSESSLRSAASTNKVSKQVEKSIEMYLKIIHLEKELENANTIKQVLKSWLN